MDLEGYQFMHREIGGDAVYPGHPVTVGLLIMKAFPSVEEAAMPDGEYHHSAASRSSKIPGAGGSVATALDILRHVMKGHMTIEKAIERADDAWRDMDNQFHRDPKRWQEGQDQAETLKARYTEALKTWRQA